MEYVTYMIYIYIYIRFNGRCSVLSNGLSGAVVRATTIVTRGKVSIKKRGSIKTGLEATGDACPPIPLFGRER